MTRLLIEELHIGLLVPRDLPAKDAAAVRRTLRAAKFERRLRQAVDDVIRDFPTLRAVKLAVSR